MRQIFTFVLLIFITFSCLSPRYSISKSEFKSNRRLWVLSISELRVDSLDQSGIPVKYTVLTSVDAGQKGDHEYDDTNKGYEYNWKPQKRIPFNKISKYYYWYDSEFNKFDLLPIAFKTDNWYLLTKWQSSSAGGGSYKLFVFVNEKGEFEKHFDIHKGSW